MRSTKAFFLGLGTALVMGRAWARRRSGGEAGTGAAIDDVTIEHRVLGDALPAAGVSSADIAVEVDDGIVVLQGSVEGSDRADALVQRVAEVPGVRDVAAMIRVSERHAA
jgi:osmotically-inducible protein OsmY